MYLECRRCGWTVPTHPPWPGPRCEECGETCCAGRLVHRTQPTAPRLTWLKVIGVLLVVLAGALAGETWSFCHNAVQVEGRVVSWYRYDEPRNYSRDRWYTL